MKFTGTFVGTKLDLRTEIPRIQRQLVDHLHDAANEWLQAVAGPGGRVPIWSGMARASLLELSELINGRILISPLKTKSRIPQGRTLGSAKQNIEKGKVNINIETNVPHYNVQEYENVGVSPRAPWNSLVAGAIAYLQYAADVTLEPPYIKPIKIKVE